MTVRLVSRRWLLITAIGFGFSLTCATGQDEKNPEAVREYIRKANVDFLIRGKIVDQWDKALSGVTVSVSRTRKIALFTSQTIKEKQTVGPAFEWRFRNNCDVYLSFRLNGYHITKLDFGGSNPSENVRIEGDTHIHDDVTVVLHKFENLTQLRKYVCVLSQSFEGGVQAWDVSNVGAEGKRTSSLELDSLPAPGVHCVYVHIVGSNAPIAPALQADREISPRDGIVQVVLQDHQDGGFIRVPRAGRSQKEMLLAMTSAPEEGYSPTLDLSAEDLAAVRRDNIYFYCRINGLYGRGFVNSVLFRPDFGVKSCDLRFFVQPDGSTNVETASWH